LVKPVGLRGELKLRESDDFWPQALASAHLQLASPQGRRAVRVVAARPHGAGATVVQLAGIADRDAAAGLCGCEVWLAASAGDVAPPPVLRPFQVRGFRVERLDGSAAGRVVDLVSMPAHSLLVVRDGEREYWVPNVPAIVVELDAARRVVRIDPPPGLLELEP
jgi:16S rRNA processing protein RimM